MTDESIAAAVASASVALLQKFGAHDAVLLTVKLIECRDTARAYLAEEYDNRTGEIKRIIAAVSKGGGMSLLEAGIEIANDAHLSDLMRMFTLAATVDLIEEAAGA